MTHGKQGNSDLKTKAPVQLRRKRQACEKIGNLWWSKCKNIVPQAIFVCKKVDQNGPSEEGVQCYPQTEVFDTFLFSYYTEYQKSLSCLLN